MPTCATIQNLPPEDPYRRAAEGDYRPRGAQPSEWAAIREVTLSMFEIDAAAVSATTSARATRRGRITQYVLWCHRRGYSTELQAVLRSTRIEQYIAVRSEAATSPAGVDTLRYVLRGVAKAAGEVGEAKVKAPRPSHAGPTPIALGLAPRLLRAADTLTTAERREDARAVLALVHGAGLEARYVPDFETSRVVRNGDGQAAIIDGAGELVTVSEPYGDVLLQLARRHDVLVRRRRQIVSRVLASLQVALDRTGVRHCCTTPALRAGHALPQERPS
jgi:hypothetical protein